jgi:hypothetical protein
MAEVAPEAAMAEFERLAEAADVDIDLEGLDEEETEDLEETIGAFTSAIETGRLSVDDEGQAVMVVKAGEPITFRVPLGADLMIIAGASENKRMEALLRFTCAITGQSTARINKLGVKEWKLALRIAGFLSAA